jgi:hypothetical protein
MGAYARSTADPAVDGTWPVYRKVADRLTWLAHANSSYLRYWPSLPWVSGRDGSGAVIGAPNTFYMLNGGDVPCPRFLARNANYVSPNFNVDDRVRYTCSDGKKLFFSR